MAKEKVKVGKVLYTKEDIEKRLDELAVEIEARYAGREITVVAVLKGSLFFTADLARRLTMPVRMDILEVSSYFDGTEPSGKTVLSNYLVQDVHGRDVLVVDDIADSGRTLAGVMELLRREGPKSLATCVFLNKKRKRAVQVPIDFCGFELKATPFIVGYGLDYARRFRNLPYLAELDREAPPPRKKAAKKKSKPAPKPRRKR